MSGFRIGTLWAFVAVGDEGEGLIGSVHPASGVFVPFVAADRARLESLKEKAIEIARYSGQTIRLVRFDLRADVELIRPNGAVEPVGGDSH